ncbi:MAG TPA: PAS domain-containing protein, partial [Gammaproteobacteria bacterium]|nr:PAS domain-containing protein [Gammaproteobacteria bacterium]
MGYRRFALAVTVQVALILGICVAFAYLSVTTTYYATLLLLAVVLTAQVAALVRYVQRTNRELARFMLTIRHSDFSQSFAPAPSETSFAELAAAFEEILQRFRAARTAKEEQASYLDTFVQHVPVAVMAIDELGRVDQFNHAARRLFGMSAPRQIQDLTSFGADFPQRVVALEPGRAELIKVSRGGTPLQLNVLATELKIGGRTHKIVSLLDIHGELEAREVEAWQNLIRVLTHEIMNSATPISSLAATAADLLAEARNNPGETSAIDDAHDAVETIATRSSGLVHFVDNYRRLTRLPKPSPCPCAAAELLDRAAQLMQPELSARGIALARSVTPRNLEINADPELLEQVLINLLRNAIDALGDTAQPEIRLAAEIDSAGHAVIAVRDNGK